MTCFACESSEQLLELSLPVWKQNECKENYLTRHRINLTNSQICAGYKDGKKDSCQVSRVARDDVTWFDFFFILTGRFRWTTHDGNCRRPMVQHRHCVIRFGMCQAQRSWCLYTSLRLPKLDLYHRAKQ